MAESKSDKGGKSAKADKPAAKAGKGEAKPGKDEAKVAKGKKPAAAETA